ncbi:GlxA family transcriptional regulator [Burkholderia multivorans]|uniref:GlxA family transcriptional regulator n=1 Tax=Burkholderia multivorans TaxID=87883 RepID=UPI00201842BF|nr:GlxA family transcriptional regulator [Burkholderia multivorans]MCO1368626.1 GlxA family transcriptional regulator [Burkholderia multivorans]MCO1380517.1 GlxA family transcriptional regulator [Burkholderia multivorans]MDN8032419.1 GlxA family transcriptional regulator [Burkholderia multivorans]UQP22054.1 GlxA family transcriptional regulator [Burkholderia multivorans]UQP91498.1 GlxA family transcriptional regulator [Burkholderia multivorans]
MTGGKASTGAPVRFGIVLLQNFTLTAFSGFVDVLRLASDEGDHSRPDRCDWQIVGENLAPIRASCGVRMSAWVTYDEAPEFDYVVVVGGLLHAGSEPRRATLDYLRRVAAAGKTLVGVCTGAFALMRAGLMANHRTCVSWFHYWDFLEQFPDADPDRLVADRLFVMDGRRITCSGGRSSIDVAAAILGRHMDASAVQKALRILQVDDPHTWNAPQAHPPSLSSQTHPKVRRAILLMEQHMSPAIGVDELARKLDMSVRQLERHFKAETGMGPQAYAKLIRVRFAAWLLGNSDKTVATIASTCGFADASHLGREFRVAFGTSPSRYRQANADQPPDGLRALLGDCADMKEMYPARVEFH